MADRFQELLRSPLDEPDAGFRAWWPLLAGIALGGLLFLVGYMVAGSGEAEAVASATTSTTIEDVSTTTTVPPADFPPGYTAISDLVAVKPQYAVDTGGTLQVAMTTATLRGIDPSNSTPFEGGLWELDTADGTTLEGRGTAIDFNVPGAFSVIFSYEGDEPPVPDELRLVSGFTVLDDFDELAFEFSGFPFELRGEEVLAVPPGDALVIDELVLGEDGATVAWSTRTGTPVNVSLTLYTTEPSGEVIAQYYDPVSPGFFGPFAESVEPTESSGLMSLPRDPGFRPAGSEVAPSRVTLHVGVSFIRTYPASATLDVSGIEIVDG